MTHISVLSQELLTHLAIEPNNIVVDATINGGGHSSMVSRVLGVKGTLVGIDLDKDALREAREQLRGISCRIIFVEGNYRNIDALLSKEGIAQADRVFFDLGLSSRQLEESGRGFSFKRKEPLLMTFKVLPNKNDRTAHEIVNEWEEKHIADIIFGYGEERFARRIAREIVAYRKSERIVTTTQLVAIIQNATPHWYHKRNIHCATKTFQALRIAVNDEIEGLKEALQKAYDILAPSGRIGVISFHSIEDRVVKHTFKDLEKQGCGKVLTKKPIVPTRGEIKENPRARSAKLRFFKKY